MSFITILSNIQNSKDMWFDYSAAMSTPNQRSSITGLAYVGQTCTKFRYAIIEEHGGMTSTRVCYFLFFIKNFELHLQFIFNIFGY